MNWSTHPFSQFLQPRREALYLEPRRQKAPNVRRVQASIEISGLRRPIRLSCEPWGPDVRGESIGFGEEHRYRITGLMNYAGAIKLSETDTAWSVGWSTTNGPAPPIQMFSAETLEKLGQLRQLWTSMAPGYVKTFAEHPKGCTRTLILREVGAVVHAPQALAVRFDREDFMTSMRWSWAPMAAWVEGLGGDPSSGSLPSTHGNAVEIALLRLPPPILWGA